MRTNRQPRLKPASGSPVSAVIEAAIRVMDAEGLDAVSMRRVAREVGVEAMSLYNHVRDKDDLLDGMRFRMFLDFPLPRLEGVDPFEGGRRIAHYGEPSRGRILT